MKRLGGSVMDLVRNLDIRERCEHRERIADREGGYNEKEE